MKVKVGDKVRVITGSNKGKEGKVLKIFRKDDKVLVDGVNIVKKHVKPNRQNETGGILEVEAPLHISNVKVLDKKAEKAEKKEEKETKKTVKKEAKKDETKKVVKKTATKKASKKKDEESK